MFFTSHQLISVTDLGRSVNHIKPVSTKYEFFKFRFGARGCGPEHLRDPMTILINIIQKFQGVMLGFSPCGGQARSSHYRPYCFLLVADK